MPYNNQEYNSKKQKFMEIFIGTNDMLCKIEKIRALKNESGWSINIDKVVDGQLSFAADVLSKKVKGEMNKNEIYKIFNSIKTQEAQKNSTIDFMEILGKGYDQVIKSTASLKREFDRHKKKEVERSIVQISKDMLYCISADETGIMLLKNIKRAIQKLPLSDNKRNLQEHLINEGKRGASGRISTNMLLCSYAIFQGRENEAKALIGETVKAMNELLKEGGISGIVAVEKGLESFVASLDKTRFLSLQNNLNNMEKNNNIAKIRR